MTALHRIPEIDCFPSLMAEAEIAIIVIKGLVKV
jgi:hypothetical protein